MLLYLFCLVLLKAASCAAVGDLSRGIAYLPTSRVSMVDFSSQTTSSHSVDSYIKCAYLCGQMSAKEDSCNAFSYEGRENIIVVGLH